MRHRRWSAILAGLLIAVAGWAAPEASKPPTADDLQKARTLAQAERSAAASKGMLQLFGSDWYQRADHFAQVAEAAQASNRFGEALKGWRQARWNLPAPPPNLPPHVARIFGDPRLRHTQWINAVAFSPDGDRLVTGSDDGTVKVWDMQTGHEMVFYVGHCDYKPDVSELAEPRSIRAVAFSPDGKSIASAGKDRLIRLWESATGKDIKSFAGHTDSINALAFSADGKQLLAGGVDRKGRVYEIGSGKLVHEFTGHRSDIVGVGFAPDGKSMATAEAEKTVRIWQAGTGNILAAMAPFRNRVTAVVYAPDGQSIYAAGEGPNGAKRMAVADHAEKQTFDGVKDRVRCLAVSKDGKLLATGGAERMIRLWDTTSGQNIRTLQGHTDEVNALAFSPDGQRLVSAGKDGTVRVWELGSAEQHRNLVGNTSSVWSATFSPNGKQIVTGGADKIIRVYEVASSKLVESLPGHTAPVTAVVPSPDGSRYLSCGGDRVLRLWDAAAGKELLAFTGHNATVTAVAWSPDGKRCVSGGADRLVKIWDTATGAVLQTLTGHRGVVTAVAWSVDGKSIASGGADNAIKLWDAASGKALRTLSGHAAAVGGLAFSADNLRLASCGADARVLIWNLETAAPPTQLEGNTAAVTSVAFSPDSRYVAAGGGDRLVRLWDVDSRQEIHAFRGHTEWIGSVAFSPDGQTLVSAGVDKSVLLWEIGGREGSPGFGHTRELRAVAVSPDGKRLATGGADQQVHVWEVATGRDLVTLTGLQGPIMSLAWLGDNRTLLVGGSDDRPVFVYDAIEGKLRRKVQNTASTQGVPLLTVLPNGKEAIAWVGQAQVDTIEPTTGKVTASFLAHDQPAQVRSLSFSTDGELAAVGGIDGKVRLWNVPKKERLPGGDITASDQPIGDLAFTNNKETLLTTDSKSGAVKVWNLTDRKQSPRTIQAHERPVVCIAVSPDGSRFATSSEDNSVKLWDIATGKELRTWNLRQPWQPQRAYVRALSFTPDGKQIATANINTTAYFLDCP